MLRKNAACRRSMTCPIPWVALCRTEIWHSNQNPVALLLYSAASRKVGTGRSPSRFDVRQAVSESRNKLLEHQRLRPHCACAPNESLGKGEACYLSSESVRRLRCLWVHEWDSTLLIILNLTFATNLPCRVSTCYFQYSFCLPFSESWTFK